MNETTKANPDEIDQAMERVRKDIDAIRNGKPMPVGIVDSDGHGQVKFRPVPENQPQPAMVQGELDKLNAPIEALYAQKRRDLVELQIRYHRDSVEMATTYHGKLSDLEHEAREAIRALDRKFQADAAPLRAMLDRLETMRE